MGVLSFVVGREGCPQESFLSRAMLSAEVAAGVESQGQCSQEGGQPPTASPTLAPAPGCSLCQPWFPRAPGASCRALGGRGPCSPGCSSQDSSHQALWALVVTRISASVLRAGEVWAAGGNRVRGHGNRVRGRARLAKEGVRACLCSHALLCCRVVSPLS